VTDRRTIVLDDRDLVIYAPGTREALHAAVNRVYEVAKERAAAAGERTDPETGEVRPRIYRFTFGEDNEDVTTKQRGFLHAAVLPQIAEQAVVAGERFSAETWKEHYRRMFLPDRWVMRKLPGHKRATPQRKRVSTEDLGVRGYSEHIDRVIADAVTVHGVAFVFDTDEREAVRYRAPARKPRKQPEAETA
jgi:hypothetical protein